MAEEFFPNKISERAVLNKLAVNMQIKLTNKSVWPTNMLIDSWAIPLMNSVAWHREHNYCLPKSFIHSVLLCTRDGYGDSSYYIAKQSAKWERNYFRKLLRKASSGGTPRPDLACETVVLMKGIPDGCIFTTNWAHVLTFLEDCQLIFVSKHALVVFVNLSFDLPRNCLVKTNINTTSAKLGTQTGVLLLKQRAGLLYEVMTGYGFISGVSNIKYTSSVTVYFDICTNTFVGLEDQPTRFSSAINDMHCNRVRAPRPVSLDPAGSRTLENNTKYLADAVSAPVTDFLKLEVTQPSDEDRETSRINSGRLHNEGLLSMDQYSFFQPTFRPSQTSQANGHIQHNDSSRSRDTNAAYGLYITPEQRRASFVNPPWPHQAHIQNIEDMVRYGFFYTGNGDLIRCHQCGLGLKDWGAADNPLLEHIRYSPDCQFLLNTIPPTRLAQLKASILPNNILSTRESTSTVNGQTGSRETGALADAIVLSVPPRNPQYTVLAVRISSFSKWPRDITQSPAELAEAGFFYTGCNDIVRCYVCDGGLQKWSPEDSPWVEHARWFPHCPYVRQIKGEDFIELVRLSAELNQLEAEGASGGSGDNTPAHNDDIVQVTNDLNVQERNEPERTVEEVLEETEKLRSVIKCLQCEENDANCLFLPCAHHRLCVACSADVSVCPICSKNVVHKVKTFMS